MPVGEIAIALQNTRLDIQMRAVIVVAPDISSEVASLFFYFLFIHLCEKRHKDAVQ